MESRKRLTPALAKNRSTPAGNRKSELHNACAGNQPTDPPRATADLGDGGKACGGSICTIAFSPSCLAARRRVGDRAESPRRRSGRRRRNNRTRLILPPRFAFLARAGADRCDERSGHQTATPNTCACTAAETTTIVRPSLFRTPLASDPLRPPPLRLRPGVAPAGHAGDVPDEVRARCGSLGVCAGRG